MKILKYESKVKDHQNEIILQSDDNIYFCRLNKSILLKYFEKIPKQILQMSYDVDNDGKFVEVKIDVNLESPNLEIFVVQIEKEDINHTRYLEDFSFTYIIFQSKFTTVYATATLEYENELKEVEFPIFDT